MQLLDGAAAALRRPDGPAINASHFPESSAGRTETDPSQEVARSEVRGYALLSLISVNVETKDRPVHILLAI